MADPAAPLYCRDCECYRPRHADADQRRRAEAVGHPVSAGLCWRQPVPVARQETESCGEHSELRRRQMAHQARLTGEAVATALEAALAKAGEKGS